MLLIKSTDSSFRAQLWLCSACTALFETEMVNVAPGVLSFTAASTPNSTGPAFFTFSLVPLSAPWFYISSYISSPWCCSHMGPLHLSPLACSLLISTMTSLFYQHFFMLRSNSPTGSWFCHSQVSFVASPILPWDGWAHNQQQHRCSFTHLAPWLCCMLCPPKS